MQRLRGFTLIELMMVVAIVGILAAIMVPSYRNFVCRTHIAEAKTALRAVYTNEEAYKSEFDFFISQPAADWAFLDAMQRTMTASQKYSYSVVGATSTFLATADGIKRMTGDTWELDQSLNLKWLSHHPDCE